MRFQLLFFIGIMLLVFLPCKDCKAIKTPISGQTSTDMQSELQQQLSFLVRMGEEYFFGLGNLNKNSPSFVSGNFPQSPAGALSRLQAFQASRPLIQEKVGSLNHAENIYVDQEKGVMERGKRAEEPPISLDLTFHLLREVLEMARAEQLAQQANSNRKLMDIIGK
ncbi:corticoliberin [Protopterus annectens]|uniref:corticoliberin n=1 Tax=Protopterus annectens TaxID=7888 RepID=UPI001CFA3AAC|nr:corticoliberin [Protopterus annectens]